MHDKSLKNKAIKGIIWTMGDFLTSKVFMLIIQIFLARFLLPEHFGLIAMILIVIAISQSMVNSGLQNALIRELNPTQIDYSTVFYFNLILSILLYILIYFISPYISIFYEEPILIELLRVLSLVIIINAFSIIQRTILIRSLDFKAQTIINLISSLVSGSLAIGSAYFGYGVWSLIIQNISSQLVQTFLLTLYNKWLPSFNFSYRSFKHLFSFGWKLLVAGLINTIHTNVYNVIIGRTYNTTVLGFYTQGKMLADVSAQSITTAIQKVTYPVLSKIQEDESRLLNSYRTVIKLSVYITFPFMIGLAAIAENLVPLLLGQKWLETIPFFQILCLAGMIYPLHAINLNMLQVKGRSDLFLKLEIIKMGINTAIIISVLKLNLGITMLVWSILISSIISFFINSLYSGKLLNYKTLQQLIDIKNSLILSIFMGIVVLLTARFINQHYLVELIIQVFVGVVVYLAASTIFKFWELKYIKSLLKFK